MHITNKESMQKQAINIQLPMAMIKLNFKARFNKIIRKIYEEDPFTGKQIDKRTDGRGL